MKRWNKTSTILAVNNFKKLTHAEIAKNLDKNPKAVSEWLRSRGFLKCPNYTETEIYILENFPAKNCTQFIPHKSLNALRIKKHRILKLPHIKDHRSNQSLLLTKSTSNASL